MRGVVWTLVVFSFLAMLSLGLRQSLLHRIPSSSSSSRYCKAHFHLSKLRSTNSETINTLLENAVKRSVVQVYGKDHTSIGLFIGPSKLSEGDYQTTVALQLSKTLKRSPKEIASKILDSLELGDVIERAEISGAGFINLYLSPSLVKQRLWRKLPNSDGRVGIAKVPNAQRIILDFSSPNIAKEMHVGHLRSTIIGDCLSRVLQFLGHDVLRLNHVGDWGTQFGMLIHFMKRQSLSLSSTSTSLGNLVDFYQQAKRLFDADPSFQEASRLEVVKLQSGDAEAVKAWRMICDKSRAEFQQIYDLLDVSLTERGESFYNTMLPELVQTLLDSKVAEESEGAVVVFSERFKNSEGRPLPLIVRKSDGGFLYATTDLAALRHRITQEKAQRIIYVTDAGQAQHFEMVFEAARRARILDDRQVSVSHLPFGLVLGEDGKKIKTRSGDSVKLRELLAEAVERAREEFSSRTTASSSSSLSSEELSKKARVMGIGAIKYADLSLNRESNYRFSFAKMLSLQGNTAPYMLYAYVRIRGIQRKVAPLLLLPPQQSSSQSLDQEIREIFADFSPEDFLLETAAERVLAKHLLKSDDLLLEVSTLLAPNKICDYLFDLSQKFNQFYETCPVAQASDRRLLKSRLALCTVTANTIELLLHLLGIETLEVI